MSTDLYGVRVLGVSADRLSARLRVFVVYYESAVQQALDLPDDPAFFLRALYDLQHGWRDVSDGGGPLAAITIDQLTSEGWMAEHVLDYVERADRIADRNVALDDGDWAELHDFYYERDGGWVDEHRLTQGDYLVRVTDPRWLEGVEPGRSIATTSYPSPGLRMRSADLPYLPGFGDPVAVLVPFDGRDDGAQYGSDLAFSDDGRYLAVAGGGGDVVVYGTDDWQEIARFAMPVETTGIGPDLMWVPGRPVVAARVLFDGYEPQVAWDVEAGAPVELPVQYGKSRSRTGRYRVEFGGDHGVTVVNDAGERRRLEPVLGPEREPVSAEIEKAVFTAAESRMFVLVFGEDRWIAGLDPETGEVDAVIRPGGVVMDIAVSPDGEYVVLAEDTGRVEAEPSVWRVADGSRVTIARFGMLASHLAWSPDGRFVVADLHHTVEGRRGEPSEIRIFPVGSPRPRSTAPASASAAAPAAVPASASAAVPASASAAVPAPASAAVPAFTPRLRPIRHPAAVPVVAGDPMARAVDLGVPLARSGDHEGARDLLGEWAETGGTAIGARARLTLAGLDLTAGRPDDAARALLGVAAGQDPDSAPAAQLSLALLDRYAHDGAPHAAMPHAAMPHGVASDDGAPGDRVPNAEVPDTEVPDAGVPRDRVADAGVADAGVPDAGVPGDGVPRDGVPGDGAPGDGVPDDVASGGGGAGAAEAGERLLQGLAAELRGDELTARVCYEAATGPFAAVLLARLLLTTGYTERARKLLTTATEAGAEPLAAAHAGYLLGSLSLRRGEPEEGETALRRASETARELRDDPYGPLPWIGARLGEHLAGRGADAAEVREAFASAAPLHEIAAPAISDLGMAVLDANPHAARGALHRLRTWSDDAHRHGARLATRLGAPLVEAADEPEEHPLAPMLAELDGDPESAAYASWLAARDRRGKGAWEDAREHWAAATDSGVLPYATWAGSCLAVLLRLRGDEDGARHALRHGTDSAKILELADALAAAERPEDARIAYEMAEGGDDQEVAARAAHGLGRLADKDGRREDAVAAYRRAQHSADGFTALNAAFDLAGALSRTGDRAGALEAARLAHERAAAGDHPAQVRAQVARRLADMLREERDIPACRDAYQATVDAWREHTGQEWPYEARWAFLYLAQMHGLLDDYDKSGPLLHQLREMYADQGEPDPDDPDDEGIDPELQEIAVIAALRLGLDAKFQNDLAGAEPWFQIVLDSGDDNHIPTAVAHWAELHYLVGDRAEAARLYERTLEISEDPEFVAEAAYRLGEHLADTGDPVDAARVTHLMEQVLGSSFTAFDDAAHALLARRPREAPHPPAGPPEPAEPASADDTPADDTPADDTPADDTLADCTRLVLTDPRRILPLLGQASTPEARLAATVYRTSLHAHRDAPPGVRRRLLALDAVRWGAQDLAGRFASVPVEGEPEPSWRVAAATGADVDARFLFQVSGTDQGRATAVGTLNGRPIGADGGLDGVRMWDLADGEPIEPPDGARTALHGVVAITEIDGRLLALTATAEEEDEYDIDPDEAPNRLRVWDLISGEPVCDAFAGPRGYLTAAAFTVGDGRPVVVAAGADGQVTAWSVGTGVRDGQVLLDPGDENVAMACGTVRGRPVVVVGAGHVVRTWTLEDGAWAAGVPIELPDWLGAVTLGELGGRPVLVTGSAAVPETHGADFDHRLRAWDPASGEPVGPPVSTGHDDHIGVIRCVRAGARTLAVTTAGTDTNVHVTDLSGGRPAGGPLTGHRAPLTEAAVGEVDGRLFAVTRDIRDKVRLWDLECAEPEGVPQDRGAPGYAMTCAELDGRAIVLLTDAEHRVRTWDPADGGPAGPPPWAGEARLEMWAITELGGRPVAVTGGEDDGLLVRDLLSGQPIGRPFAAGEPLIINGAACTTLAGRPVVLIADGLSEDVKRWDLPSGEPLPPLSTGVQPDGPFDEPMLAVACTELDGRPVAVAAGQGAELWMWDLAGGELAGGPMTGHLKWSGEAVGEPRRGTKLYVGAVACARLDGRPVAVTGGEDGTVRRWDLTTGRQIGPPLTAAPAGEAKEGAVVSVACGELDGRAIVVAGGGDRTVRVWDLVTGGQVGAEAVFPYPVDQVAVTRDGDVVVRFGPELAVLVSEAGR